MYDILNIAGIDFCLLVAGLLQGRNRRKLTPNSLSFLAQYFARFISGIRDYIFCGLVGRFWDEILGYCGGENRLYFSREK